MELKKFVNRLAINRQYADSTVKSYKRSLELFNEDVKKLTLNKRTIEDTSELQINDVEFFIGRLKNKGKSAKTCNWYLSVIKDFLKYAEYCWEKVMDYKKIIHMKEPDRKIDALTENDTQKLLNFVKADNTKDELTKTRDQAMIYLLVYTWLRVSELCDIKVTDIREELQIIWKNNTLRLVYLFQEHLTLIGLYLYLRQWKWISSPYLFCSHANNSKGHKLTRAAVEIIVRDTWVRAWIKTPLWPHKLRHTFATSLLRRWWNIYYIKELLGHKYITTTQTYLSATNNDLKKTQKLLQSVRGVEEEQLTPMPENVIVNNNLFNQYQRQMIPNFQMGFGRGVPTPNFQWWN